jgi:DnaK suppressor protein
VEFLAARPAGAEARLRRRRRRAKNVMTGRPLDRPRPPARAMKNFEPARLLDLMVDIRRPATASEGGTKVMKRHMMAEFAKRLRRARAQLYRTVAQTDEELATLEAPQPGASGEDVATQVVTAVLSRLQGQEKHELDEIDAAQTRLAAGTYGVCEECGMPIPLTRLRALPVARCCMPCQLRNER